jgi:hypothetical protein
MLKISWLTAAAQLLSSAVGFFTAALGKSETLRYE